MPVLVVAGAFYNDVRLQWRLWRRRVLSGPHLPNQQVAPPLNVNFVIHRLSEFMFLMLGESVTHPRVPHQPLPCVRVRVAGETMLQLVIQNEQNSHAEHFVTMVVGYIVCVRRFATRTLGVAHTSEQAHTPEQPALTCFAWTWQLAMMYTYHITEPHHAEHHALRRSSLAGVMYTVPASMLAPPPAGRDACVMRVATAGVLRFQGNSGATRGREHQARAA